MTFICLYCAHDEVFAIQEPPAWILKRYAVMGEYRYKCPTCGAAMAPESFLDRTGRRVIDPDVMWCFSDCINAGQCLLYDQYGPDCEQPGLKTKCLHALYKELEIVSFRLDRLERRLPQSDSTPPVPPAEPTPRRRSRETTHGR